MTSEQRDRIRQLVSALVDGRIEPHEHAELQERLRRDSEARRFYLRLMDVEAHLQRLRVAAQRSTHACSADTAAGHAVRQPTADRRAWQRASLVLAAASALAVCLFIGVRSVTTRFADVRERPADARLSSEAPSPESRHGMSERADRIAHGPSERTPSVRGADRPAHTVASDSRGRDGATGGTAYGRGDALIALQVDRAWFAPSADGAQDVDAAAPREPWRRIASGAALPPRSMVRVLAEGEAALRFADGTVLTLLGPCVVALDVAPEESTAGKRIVVLEGQLTADVAPQPANRPLRIITAEGAVRVLGTRLSVAALPDVGTQVELKSGRIELQPSGGPALAMRAGSVAFVPAGGAVVRVRPIPESGLQPQQRWQFRRLESIGFGPGGELLGFADGNVFRQHDEGPTEFLFGRTERNGRRASCWKQRGEWLVLRPRNLPEVALLNASTGASRRVPLPSACWDFRHGRLAGDWQVAIAADAATIAVYRKANPGALWVWNETSRAWRDCRPDYRITSVSLSPDGHLIAVCTARFGHDRGHGVVLIDGQTIRERARLSIDRPYPYAAAFSSDGRSLAAAITSFGVQLWDLSDWRRSPEHPPRLRGEAEIRDVPTLHVAVSGDGSRVAVAGASERVWVYRTGGPNTDEPLVCMNALPFEAAAPVRELAFTPDGRRLVARDKRQNVTVWNLPDPLAPANER